MPGVWTFITASIPFENDGLNIYSVLFEVAIAIDSLNASAKQIFCQGDD
jgi:hypothetical protein